MSQHNMISQNFMRGIIGAPVVTPNLVDVTFGPSQSHVCVFMSNTVSSALDFPSSICVDVFASSAMSASVGRLAATLLISRLQ